MFYFLFFLLLLNRGLSLDELEDDSLVEEPVKSLELHSRQNSGGCENTVYFKNVFCFQTLLKALKVDLELRLNKKKLTFKLTDLKLPKKKYLAIGLSLDKKMGEDRVIDIINDDTLKLQNSDNIWHGENKVASENVGQLIEKTGNATIGFNLEFTFDMGQTHTRIPLVIDNIPIFILLAYGDMIMNRKNKHDITYIYPWPIFMPDFQGLNKTFCKGVQCYGLSRSETDSSCMKESKCIAILSVHHIKSGFGFTLNAFLFENFYVGFKIRHERGLFEREFIRFYCHVNKELKVVVTNHSWGDRGLQEAYEFTNPRGIKRRTEFTDHASTCRFNVDMNISFLIRPIPFEPPQIKTFHLLDEANKKDSDVTHVYLEFGVLDELNLHSILMKGNLVKWKEPLNNDGEIEMFTSPKTVAPSNSTQMKSALKSGQSRNELKKAMVTFITLFLLLPV